MRLLKVLVVIITILVVVVLLAPWKQWVEHGLKSLLVRQGIQGVEFNVSMLTPEGITLSDIRFGDALTLSEVTVAYSIMELAKGQVKELKASNLVLKSGQQDIIFNDATILFEVGKATQTWQGRWDVSEIVIENSSYPLPPVEGRGYFTATTEKLDADGTLESADKTHYAAFKLDYDLKDSSRSNAIISMAELPWNGGLVQVKDGQVYFSGKDIFKGVLTIKKVQLDTLMRTLTANKTTATGEVSGRIPLVVTADGTPLIKDATLSAGSDGKIVMSGDALPGDNEQINIVRNVLSNFQYDTLAITMQSDAQKKLSAKLLLEGKNPDLYESRPVKLNVQLNGDVLSLLRQSLPALSDPTQLLKQGEHAKP